MEPVSITPIHETVLTISFGNSIDIETSKKIFQVYRQLVKQKHSSWIDIIPAYSTVTIVYDMLAIRKHHASAFQWVKGEVEKILTNLSEEEVTPPRHIKIPVCYNPEFAVDADRIKKDKSVSLDELIEIHASKMYHVFMIGFLPGFAYMGSVDSRIAVPRLATPRTHIAAGSVGIAGEQTGIYPLDSPGGWNIIGRTPLKIFDSTATDPVLFKPGDQVSFVPISRKEFDAFDQSIFKLVMDEY